MGGKEDFTNENWNRCKHHVLVGGQKLDRGFTVKNLIVTYMPVLQRVNQMQILLNKDVVFLVTKKTILKHVKFIFHKNLLTNLKNMLKYEKHLEIY